MRTVRSNGAGDVSGGGLGDEPEQEHHDRVADQPIDVPVRLLSELALSLWTSA